MADGQQLVIGRLLEARQLGDLVDHFLLLGVGLGVVVEEVADLLLGGVGQVLVHDQRVQRDQRRGPDDLDVLEFLGLALADLFEVFAVVGGDIHLFVGHGQGVGFVSGVNGAFEIARGDVVFGKDVVAGNKEA
ncbi:hypothetical protein SDC9_122172 [bioreactor metagenome]|uniref:NAD-specific glutamate dehydrogenase n=1 Tax=bioreactor metagenome TaxID=1076179 RepID=A0A645CE30_9ZZZZ